MSDVIKTPDSSELGLHIPIAPGVPEGIAVVLRAAMGLKAEIDSIDSTLLTPSDEPIAMPNQPSYGAGDVTVIATVLRRINTVMYEVEYRPESHQTGGRLTSYAFVLPLEITAEGVKPQREYSGHVTMRKSSDPEEVPKRMGRSYGPRAQEIILKRGTKQLREKRMSNEAASQD